MAIFNYSWKVVEANETTVVVVDAGAIILDDLISTTSPKLVDPIPEMELSMSKDAKLTL